MISVSPTRMVTRWRDVYRCVGSRGFGLGGGCGGCVILRGVCRGLGGAVFGGVFVGRRDRACERVRVEMGWLHVSGLGAGLASGLVGLLLRLGWCM